MKWLRYERNWRMPINACIDFPGLGSLQYLAMPDTGSGVTVLPGRVIDAQLRRTVEGDVFFHRVMLVCPNRSVKTVELEADGTTSIRRWGDPEYCEFETFRHSLTVGDYECEGTKFVFIWPDRDDEPPHIVLGRSLLFHLGGCCFDEKGKQMRLSLCLPRRLLTIGFGRR